LHIGTQEFIEPAGVRKNKVAHAKWLEIMEVKENADADWITSADASLLEMICMTAAELDDLEKIKKELKKQVKAAHGDLLKEGHAANQLNIDNNINKKRDLLFKLLKEICWTPLSRIGHIGKKVKKEEETPLQKAGFGFV
jgi:hypothetical protein